MAEYAGESVAKKVARIRLYKRVREMLMAVGKEPSKARVVFLPGPDASEAGALLEILKVRPENVLAIDRDEKCVRAAEKKLPGCSWIHGSLSDFDTLKELEKWGRPDFIHLDLMGTMSATTAAAYGQYGHWLEPNGIIALTYLRARELPEHLDKMLWTKKVGTTMADRQDKAKDKDSRRIAYIVSADSKRTMRHAIALIHYSEGWAATLRFKGDMKKARAWLFNEKARRRELKSPAACGFNGICSYAYRGEVSPMGVVALQKTNRILGGSDDYRRVWFRKSPYVRSAIRRDSMLDLLKELDILKEEGLSEDQIAAIADVGRGTLPAWRAHRTMGTYS